MFKINKHKITTIKRSNLKLAFLSDIHYHKDFNFVLQHKIINNIKYYNPDYICITGDIVDKSDIFDNDNASRNLLVFLENLANITKVFIVLGSHDLEDVKKPKDTFKDYIVKWKELLKNEQNIYLLDNEQYEDKKVNIIGITLPFNYYHQRPIENVDIIIEELNKEKYKVDNKYNILLIHSPRRILTPKAIYNIDLLKNIDLILSGHMHNGIMPKFLQKLPGTRGIISPHKTLFPKYARGTVTKMIYGHECKLIITGGVTKISPALPKYIKCLKGMYNNEIEFIKVSGKDD